MAGTIKLGGNTIATHTGAVGGGTVTLETQNIKLPDSGGVTSPTAITISSTGKVTTADSELNVKTTSHTFTVKGVDEAIGDSQSGTAPDTTDSDSGQFAVYNGPTKLFGITEHGYVLKPNNPHFRGYQNGGFSGNGTLCQFSETINIGNHWSTTNHRFTVPVSGVYLVTLNFISSSSTKTLEQNIHIAINGITLSDVRFRGYSESSGTNSLAIYLSAGDYIEFEIGNANTTTYSLGGPLNVVTITQLN